MCFSMVGRSDKEEVVRKRTKTTSLVEYANEKRDLGLFNDIEVCTGGKSFPANKMVLSCFSLFFEKMFTVNMKEKYQKSLSIDIVEAEIMKNLIDFVYSGKLCINVSNVCSLLFAADYLQIIDVIQYCFEYLQSVITPENCFLIRKIAEQYKNHHLVEAVNQFIIENFDEIACSEDFKNFSKSELMDFLSELDRNRITETSFYKAATGWTKHDQENREKQFYQILELVKLHKLPTKFLQDVVASDNLVLNSLECSKLLVQGFSKHTNELVMKETGTRILSLGGKYSSTKVTEVFNCLQEPLQKYPDLPECRMNGCSEKLGNHIYYVGGQPVVQCPAANTVWRLELGKQELNWIPYSAGFNAWDSETKGAVHNGTFVVNSESGRVESYIGTNATWVQHSYLPYHDVASLVICKDFLYAVGLPDLESKLRVQMFNAENKTWESIGRIKSTRRRMAAVSLGEFIYVIGGNSGKNFEACNRLKSIERIFPEKKQCWYTRYMKFERESCAACVMQGKIYVVGGVDAEDEVVKEIECYDPSADEWSVVGVTEDELVGHSLVVV